MVTYEVEKDKSYVELSDVKRCMQIYDAMGRKREIFSSGTTHPRVVAEIKEIIKDAKELIPEELKDEEFCSRLRALENIVLGLPGCAKRE